VGDQGWEKFVFGIGKSSYSGKARIRYSNTRNPKPYTQNQADIRKVLREHRMGTSLLRDDTVPRLPLNARVLRDQICA